MTNENNAAQGKHLDSLAAATKRYILAQILDVTDAVVAELSSISSSGVLDTVCPSVNGGLWYELDSGKPVVKIYYGGQGYQLGGGALEPTLTVAPSSLNISVGESASATISCDSGGNYLVTSLTEGVTAELVDNVITVAHVLGIEEASVKIRVMASSGFNAAEILLPVRMAKASPNLQVTPSTNTVPCAGVVTAEVSYSGGGTISVSSDNANVTPTYDANTQTITVPYNAYETSATITVALTASTGYLAATQSFTVTMQKSRNLTISPATATIAPDGTANFTVSYDGGGTATLTWDDARVYPTYSTLPGTVTVPYYAYPTDTTVTFTVSVPASGDYPAATATFTVLYEGVDELVSCLPFTTSLYEELASSGNWKNHNTGGAVLANGALFSNNTYGIITDNCRISLGGQDFTVRCWFNMASKSVNGSWVFNIMLYENYPTFCLYLYRNSSVLEVRAETSDNGTKFLNNIAYTFGTWAHFEADYIHNSGLTRFFLNGNYIGSITMTINRQQRSRKMEVASPAGNSSILSVCYVDEFQVYDGVALHTENFTPPARSST
ncbi:MAG: hypothetical protein IKO05_12390 [Selenomonadaceae bacterium]|nr:hypothetical protein [Selenomonadaceae bacterium]